MKKIIIALLALVFTLAPAADAPAETQTQKSFLTYSRVVNKDINIDNFEIGGATRSKEIHLEGALIEYLASNDLSIRINFTVSKQSLVLSGKALQTPEYLAAKKSGENLSAVIKVFTSGDSLVTKYFSTDAMNLKGLYSSPETALLLQAEMLKNGRFFAEYTDFAAPIMLSSPYTWGEGAFATPGRMTADRLRYYYVADPDENPGFSGYTWDYAGGTVHISDKEISVPALHSGFYCALASSAHEAGTGAGAGEAEKPQSATGFLDLAGHWAEGSIAYLQGVNVIRNEGDYFYPNRNITRAEYAFYLSRVLNLEEDLTAAPQFTDLNPAKYYYKEALTAAGAGLISGKGQAGIFAPEDAITRQEMAAMITRALAVKGKSVDISGNKLQEVADYTAISPWALKSCQTVYQAGLMAYQPGKKFAPLAHTTRGEAAAILNRLHAFVY